MASVAAPVETNDVSLVERISKIEEALKDLKRAARQELKARRRRRANKVAANGERAPKGETPQQLKAWHAEVRKVWDEMKKADAKTPYKRAVAEASARRKGPVAAAPAVAEKKAKKVAAAAAPAPVAAAAPVAAEKKAVKKAAKA